MSITWEQIMENRRKAIAFLGNKHRKKATGILDRGNGERCCLGHFCYAMGYTRKSDNDGYVWYFEESEYAPNKLMYDIGLRDNSGGFGLKGDGKNHVWDAVDDLGLNVDQSDMENYCSLAEINDHSPLTPQRIAKKLESVIEGGECTPFLSKEEFMQSERYRV